MSLALLVAAGRREVVEVVAASLIGPEREAELVLDVGSPSLDAAPLAGSSSGKNASPSSSASISVAYSRSAERQRLARR